MLLMSTATTTPQHGSTSAPPEASNGPYNLVQMPLSIINSYLRKPSPSRAPENGDESNVNTPDASRQPETNEADLASPTTSRPVSSGSSAGDEKSRKRSSRPKTAYLIAKPARPVDPRSKLHIRPKVLMQLHQVIAAQRPKPVYEVIPFSLLPQRSTRRLARTFNTRERIGPNDLLVVGAEAYSSHEDSKREDDRWDSREVIAVISPGKCERGFVNGAPEICMNDGTSRWEVTTLPNGNYEFTTTDDHGLVLKARWVAKPAHSRRTSGLSTTSQASPGFAPSQDDKKFNFSTISANSRRHPVIATLTRTKIDVLDSYSMPSATSPPTPSIGASYSQSPLATPSSIDMESFMGNPSLPITTDDALRRFIVVSGLWVASQHFFATDSQPSTPVASRSPNIRATSMSAVDTPRSASPASDISEKRHSLPRMFRTSTERLPRSASFTDAFRPNSTKTSPTSSPRATRPRRANSTGQPLSMTGSMRKRYGLAFEDQAPQESEEEKQNKRSIELLRIKELALPSPIERPSLENSAAASKSTTPRDVSPAKTTLPAPLLSPPLDPSPQPDPERSRKAQSAYNPVTTAGMWDSGVAQGPSLKARPTSMVVVNERKRKEEKKRERSKSKEERKSEARNSVEGGLGLKRKSDWYKYKLKLSLKGLFGKKKDASVPSP